MVVSQCIRNGKETVEIHYYISSLAVSVKRFAHAVRSHWGIENTCHWSLDVTYREVSLALGISTFVRTLRGSIALLYRC
jgi:predicted transposase YbfD/YdcC